MDPIFEQEQAHLADVHAKLAQIKEELVASLRETLHQASIDKSDMAQDLALDFTSDDMSMETYADLEAMNRIIDAYNLSSQIDSEKLTKVELLLDQPYFAKVSLRFKPGEAPRDIYLGTAGITDEKCRHFIVDWRSPIAETYYNQKNGQTSYRAHGRTIPCELLLRRQFDIWHDKLNAYFDTTVAIEDPLLLSSLLKDRSSSLHAITATIQKEQNRVIRHDDVDVLIVNGVAGSGKTSVLLQRIAYLFYQKRDELDPKQVYLISPNPVFGAYIANVLPDMGEQNPKTVTYHELMEALDLGSRASCKDPSTSSFSRIDSAMESFIFDANDFCDLRIGDERVVTSNQVRSAHAKFSKIPVGSRLAGLVEEELLERVHQRIKRLSKSEDVHDTVAHLDLDEQIRIFGRLAQAENDEEAESLACAYLQDLYLPVIDAIGRAEWLRIDRIGLRLLNQDNLTAEEWLYLKMRLTGFCDRTARYVMIDEVQDYSAAQLTVMVRYFKNAHFLLLGDEYQAISTDTATFDEMRRIFAQAKGTVSECELGTSYRSTPEITELFCRLLPQKPRIKISSVQPSGEPVCIKSFDDAGESYERALKEAAKNLVGDCGLCAIIAYDGEHARKIAQQLDDIEEIELIASNQRLPDKGVVVLPLKLAKGLEFDRVIIADASENRFKDDLVSRHRLYTALSRATKQATLLSPGPMTPLIVH